MEKILVKTGIYSFLISYMFMFVFVKRKSINTDVNGVSSGSEIPYPDFINMITRYSIIITIFSVILV